MDALNALLAPLGQRLGIDGLRADDSGYCALSIDQAFVLHLVHVEARDSVQCMAELGPLPRQGRATLMAELLHANALLAGTDGATLALDVARDVALLCRELPLPGLDFVAFERALESFVLQVDRWTARLRAAAAEGDDADAPQAASAPSAAAAAGQPAGWLRG